VQLRLPASRAWCIGDYQILSSTKPAPQPMANADTHARRMKQHYAHTTKTSLSTLSCRRSHLVPTLPACLSVLEFHQRGGRATPHAQFQDGLAYRNIVCKEHAGFVVARTPYEIQLRSSVLRVLCFFTSNLQAQDRREVDAATTWEPNQCISSHLFVSMGIGHLASR
jgi:hypothetical protein